VGIVTLNAADVLERALAGVPRHKSAALEPVVMDRGSTDGTLEILRRHEHAIDLWRTGPDEGIYDAMNKILRAATGDWLLFLGTDDELLVRVEDLLSDMIDPGTVYYGDVLLRNSGLRSGGRFSAYRLMQEYAVLVWNTYFELQNIGQLYRDSADCENGFDVIKNQWGWGGYSTHDIERCALSARAVALISNWWSWYVRLAHPKTRLEAVTSRPKLLSGVGRMTSHAGQKEIPLTITHEAATQV
jgi:glycosyltransferase involved in cell wall biosynthesis